IAAIMASYDFSSIRTLVDVGGGVGSLFGAILQEYSDMRGVLCDLPPVIESARQQSGIQGLGDRCQLVGVDFFASVPTVGDAYLFKHVLHDWDDERAIQILKKCHDVMPGGSRLIVIEMVIASDYEGSLGKTLDLQMLLIGGKERRKEEFQDLFRASGFELMRIIATPSPVSIMEGRK